MKLCRSVLAPLSVACAMAMILGPSAVATAETQSQSGDSVRGVTDTTVTIGGVAELKSFAGTDVGAKARFARANKEGGIEGRKIKFVGVKDDGSDPSRNQDLVRELVQQDEVFAVAPVISQSFSPQSSDFLADNAVPFFGWGFSPGFCGNDFGYGFNGCLISSDYYNSSLIDASIKASKLPAKKVKFAFQGEDGPAGVQGNAAFAAVAEDRGAEVVYQEANIPLEQTTTDYTPYVQAIIDSDPNIVYAAMGFENTVGLTGALNAAGFDGIVLNFSTYVPGLLEAQPELAQAIDGAYVNTQVVPAESRSPLIKQIQKDLKAIGEPTDIGLGTEVSWLVADQLVQMLEATGKDLTPRNFQEAINEKGFTYEPGKGSVGPVSFPKAHLEPEPCAAVVKVKGTKYKQVAAMACYEVLPAK